MNDESQSIRRALVTAIGSICVVGLATGLTLPLVSLRLTQAGAVPATIAAMAALPAVGTIGVSFCLSGLTRALGSRMLLIGAMTLSCASVLVLASPYAPMLWMLSRLAMGVSTGILFALGEARVLEVSAGSSRGRWTAVYAMTLTACQFAGPALLAAAGPDALTPIVITALMHLIAIALLIRTGWHSTLSEDEESLSLREFLCDSLPLAVAVLFFAMFDSAVLSLLPIYGLKIGLTARLAVLTVTVVFLGDSCLQLPLGWAADRLARSGAHAACGLLTGVMALALAFGLFSTPAMWLALFVMGGAAGGTYTLALVRIGDRFSGARLISANAYVGLLWGAGGLAGPLLGGAAMQAINPRGLMLFVAAGAFAFLVSMLYRGRPAAGATGP